MNIYKGINIEEAFYLCNSLKNYRILIITKDINEFEYYKNEIDSQMNNLINFIAKIYFNKNRIEIYFLNGSYLSLYPINMILGLRVHRAYYSNNINDEKIINEIIKPQVILNYMKENS